MWADIRERKKWTLPLKTGVVILAQAYPNTCKIPIVVPGLSDGFTGVGNSLEWKFEAFKLVWKISCTSLVFLSFSSNQIAGFLHQQCLHEESVDLISFFTCR